ncbi:MAG: biotin synthase BioB [Desulfovibrionaceae bacterium]|nr:biotin synthase BioB [Desulfovibrionaceae bacterium]
MDLNINTLDSALKLLELSDPKLFTLSNTLRIKNFGPKIDLCAIINCRSGNCAMDCAFCAQSSHYNTKIKTYPLLPPHILTRRIYALAKLPVSHIGLVTSGKALNQEEVLSLGQTLKTLPMDLKSRLCASMGGLSEESLAFLKSCGLTRYHHNLETSADFYPHISHTQTYKSRQDTVLRARKQGFTNCTGGLFGLGESFEDRLKLALTLKEMHIQNIPLNFLHPQPNTPLANLRPLKSKEALRIIALFRIILPKATLRICGGRPLTFGKDSRDIFRAGANALMIGDYLTTKGAGSSLDLARLASLGLEPHG